MDKVPFNININGQSNTNNEDNVINEFKDYIIQTNKILTNENNILRNKLDEVNKENSEKEDEIDKYDEKIRYMRGLLQNLYLLKEKSTTLKNKWENHTKNYCKISNDFLVINEIYNYYIYISFLFYSINTFYTNKISYLFLFIVSQFISFLLINIQQKLFFKNIKIVFFKNKQIVSINLNDNIETFKNEYENLLSETKDSNKEIEDLERGTVGVSQLIDNI
tara:strand:+ start:59 stop:721 length:663 start_codon:yes stop_codon:yes gene_type:complete